MSQSKIKLIIKCIGIERLREQFNSSMEAYRELKHAMKILARMRALNRFERFLMRLF